MSYKPPAWLPSDAEIEGVSTQDHYTTHSIQRRRADGAWVNEPGQSQRVTLPSAQERFSEHKRAFPSDELRIVRTDEWKHWLKATTVVEPKPEPPKQRTYAVETRIEAASRDEALNIARKLNIEVYRLWGIPPQEETNG